MAAACILPYLLLYRSSANYLVCVLFVVVPLRFTIFPCWNWSRVHFFDVIVMMTRASNVSSDESVGHYGMTNQNLLLEVLLECSWSWLEFLLVEHLVARTKSMEMLTRVMLGGNYSWPEILIPVRVEWHLGRKSWIRNNSNHNNIFLAKYS